MATRVGDVTVSPYPPPLAVRTNRLAIASLVTGLLFVTTIGAVLAIVFGHIARSQIKDSRGWQRGNGMAVAGIVLGYAWVAVVALALVAGAGAFD